MKPNDEQVIAGGEEVAVVYHGQPATAFVRQVKPTELADYLRREAKGENDILELVATIDGAAVDLSALGLDSYDALIEADQRQNFTAARRKEKREAARAARQLAVLRETDPTTYKQLHGMQEKAMESLLSSLGQSVSGQGVGQKSPQ